MTDRDVDGDQVRAEHLAEIDEYRQWAYLLGVILGALLIMLILLAVLEAASG